MILLFITVNFYPLYKLNSLKLLKGYYDTEYVWGAVVETLVLIHLGASSLW